MLKGKKIILGITGSIAAYKACYIIRGLIRQGAEAFSAKTKNSVAYETLCLFWTLVLAQPPTLSSY